MYSPDIISTVLIHRRTADTPALTPIYIYDIAHISILLFLITPIYPPSYR